MSATYRIPDEPLAGQPRGLVVDPFWALLAIMIGGAWLGAAMFALNAYFLRGPTWERELQLVAAMLLGAAVIGYLVLVSQASGALPAQAFDYSLLLVVAWKLALTYRIYFLQQTGFALFQYFGGKVTSGLPIVLVGGLVLRPPVLLAFDHPVWRLIVS